MPDSKSDLKRRAEQGDWVADINLRTPPGWYGLASPDGWDHIVKALHEKIKSKFPDYEVYQIKEKFGGLRFYCSVEHDPEVAEWIADAEAASLNTCEKCGGSPANQDPDHTVCEDDRGMYP